MAVFVNYHKKYFVFTSYKVAYSTLLAQPTLKYLNYILDYPIIKHVIKHYDFRRYLLVRNPYQRIFSLFQDKFRKQPKRILNNEHVWENVHKIMFPYLGLNITDSDDIIANAFFNMQLNSFITLLPKILNADAHLIPQFMSHSYRIFNYNYPIPIHKTFTLEHELNLFEEQTGLDFSKKYNISGSENRDYSFTRKSLKIINDIYSKDFCLGNYPMERK